MDYELFVETNPDNWERLDISDESEPAMVFQLNDLNELESRKQTYSQAINLPFTDNNCRIFGFADVFEAKSKAPYLVRRCILYYGGLVVAGTTYKLTHIKTTNNSFYCQIVSHTNDIFTTLSGKDMSGVTALRPFDWTVEDLTAANNTPSGRKYFVTAAHQRANGFHFDRYATSFTQNAVMLSTIYPYYPVMEVVRAILADEGYTLETDVEDMPGYEPAYFSLPDLVPGGDSFNKLQPKVTGPRRTQIAVFPQSLVSSAFTTSNMNYQEWGYASFDDPDGELERIQAFEYTSPGALKVKFNCYTTGSSGRVWYRVRRKGYYINADGSTSNGEVVVSSPNDKQGIPITSDGWTFDGIEVSPGERLYVEAYLISGNISQSYQTTVSVIIDPSENKVCPGGKVYPALSTGFANQKDCFGAFIKLYGLFVDVDIDKKIMRAYTFDSFFNKIDAGDTVDWSGKLDDSKPNATSYSMKAYASHSNILLTRNDVLDFQDKGTLVVGNANLPDTKDLFTIGVESSKNIPVYGNITGETSGRLKAEGNERIGYWDVNTTDFNYIPRVKLTAAKPHIVKKGDIINFGSETGYSGVRYIPQVMPYEGWIESIPAGEAIPMSWFMDNYYKRLQSNILNPVYVVEDYLRFTPEDIANLDLLKPVYIDWYGEYFYVQKIDNFMANRSIRCTLVCLNLTND